MKIAAVFLALSLIVTGCGNAAVGTSDPGPLGKILDASPDDPGWGTFSSALRQDGLADVREKLMEGSPYTAFVPNNAAFEKYFEARGITKEAFLASSKVSEIVRAHIAPGNYYPKTFFETDSLTFDNLNGDPLTVSARGSDFYVNDVLIDGPVLENTQKVKIGALYSLLGVIEP